MYYNMKKEKEINLTKELNQENYVQGWERDWFVFGPVPNYGCAGNWPGQIGFSRLELDAVTKIPQKVEIKGEIYTARKTVSKNGLLNFSDIFGVEKGLPIVYIITEIIEKENVLLPICFGANWGTQWWCNGKLVYATLSGNVFHYNDPWANQFYLPLKKGRNILTVKIVAGSADDWKIQILSIKEKKVKGEISDLRRLHSAGISYNRSRQVKSDSFNYKSSGLRIEYRPGPLSPENAEIVRETMVQHNIHAHWIGIVDPTGSPYADSQVLPPGKNYKKENAALLKQQVQKNHEQGISVMTWFPGIHSYSTALKYHSWRMIPFPSNKNSKKTALPEPDMNTQSTYALCVNAPYGNALIEFIIESLREYELDGFWLDGTFLSYEDTPTCICEFCQKKFKDDTGKDMPKNINWDNPDFLLWVKWRYDMYMEFWGKLSATVRRIFPNATIVVNHLHRLYHGWYSGIPLNRYNADIVAGSEATDIFESAFHAREQRAYATEQAEVWTGMHDIDTKKQCCYTLPPDINIINRHLHHAGACITAGAMPSFGTPNSPANLSNVFDKLNSIINPAYKYIGGTPEYYAGLLLSQQTETFFFSRQLNNECPVNYWNTVLGWHNLIIETQSLLDIIFDDFVTPEILNRYPVIIAPCAVALSLKQIKTFEDYIINGGTLVIDKWFGLYDEWGNPRKYPKESIFGKINTNSNIPPLKEIASGSKRGNLKIFTVGKGYCLLSDSNIGMSFLNNRNRKLTEKIISVIRTKAEPAIRIYGCNRIHIGMYRQNGKLYLHLQNFVPYSSSKSFPNPVLSPPAPAKNIEVHLTNYNIKSAQTIKEQKRKLKIKNKKNIQSFVIREIKWHEIIELQN